MIRHLFANFRSPLEYNCIFTLVYTSKGLSTTPMSRTAIFLLFISAWICKLEGQGVVLILADDMGAHLSSLGTKGIETTALDQMAKEGVLFTEAFSSCASCSPSRSSILTGMYPHSNGHWRNTWAPKVTDADSEFTKSPQKTYDHVGVYENVPTMTEVLSQAGVYSGITTKFHLSHPWKYRFDGRIKEGSGPSGYATMLKKLIIDAGEKPFYIQVNVATPHRPFRNHLKHLTGDLPDMNEIEVPPFLADTEEMRKDLQEYYACVEVADQSVGAIIETLKELEVYDDLLVIFTADQGMAYHRAKASPYHAGTHIPMIIRGPGIQGDRVNGELVSLVDLMPTILDHLGLEIPSSVQGKSLMPILSGDSQELEGRDYIFAEHNSHGPDEREWYPSRAVYDGRYYYIQNLHPAKTYLLPADLEFEKTWGNYAFQATLNARDSHPEHYRLLMELQENRPPQELYDMSQDPGQLKNLAGYGNTEEVRKYLKVVLEKWMLATGDSILQIMNLD